MAGFMRCFPLLLLWLIVSIIVRSEAKIPPTNDKNLNFLVPIPLSICGLHQNKETSTPETLHNAMLLDNKHKVIMDWTPKAACTKVVEMFWNEMGIMRGLYYPEDAFVHHYRSSFYRSCGKVTQGMLNGRQYYKFKVVRNPFNRAVSSYLHVMKTKIAHTLSWSSRNSGFRDRAEDEKNELNNQSFEQYLDHYMEAVNQLGFQHIANDAFAHTKPQSSEEEVKRHKAHDQSIFNHIVHLENFDEDIAVVNRVTHLNYSFPIGDDAHVIHKIEQTDMYFGNITYSDILRLHGVPENYGKFYNRKTKRQVAIIFANDLRIYNYSFPFSRIY